MDFIKRIFKGDPTPLWQLNIEKEAEKIWEEGSNASFMIVYITAFGEHVVIPVRDEDIDQAITKLKELKK